MTTSDVDRSSAQKAGAIAFLGFIGIALFQLALALGAPLGRAAWGGRSSDLSAGLRVGSAVAVAVWLLAATIVWQRAGLGRRRWSLTLLRRGTWIIFGIMSLSSVLNFASRSPWERYIWGPVGLVMALLCFIVARSRSPD